MRGYVCITPTSPMDFLRPENSKKQDLLIPLFLPPPKLDIVPQAKTFAVLMFLVPAHDTGRRSTESFVFWDFAFFSHIFSISSMGAMFYFPAQLEFFESFFSFSFLFFFYALPRQRHNVRLIVNPHIFFTFSAISRGFRTNNAMNGFQVGHIGCLALVTCSALHFLYLGGNLYLGFFLTLTSSMSNSSTIIMCDGRRFSFTQR